MPSSPRVVAITSESQASSVYVDTSALGRALLDEPEKPAIESALDTFDHSVSSRLLRIELRRLGALRDMLDRVDRLMVDVSFIALDEQLLSAAETLTPLVVRTLDAIHLATAVRLANDGELDALMTYDKQLAVGAREHGLTVLSPS